MKESLLEESASMGTSKKSQATLPVPRPRPVSYAHREDASSRGVGPSPGELSTGVATGQPCQCW